MKKEFFHDRWVLIVATLFALTVQGGLVFFQVTPVLEGELFGPDGYMHLARARELATSGNWFESVTPLINAPGGAPVHFSRLYDLLLLFGASLGSLFVGFERSLWGWGILVSPFLHLAILLTYSYGTRPYFSNREFLILSVLVSAQRPMIDPLMVGRPDHHALLVFLLVALVALLLRSSKSESRAPVIFAGLVSGLALWTLVEGLLVVLIAFIFFGVLFIQSGEPAGRKLRNFSLALALSTTTGALLQNPPATWLTPSGDIISSAHIFLTLLGAFFLGLTRLGKIRTFLNSPIRRTYFFLLAGAATAGIMAAIFPDFFKGPMAQIDPFVKWVLMDAIPETLDSLPVDAASAFRFFINLGPALMVFPFALYGYFKGSQEKRPLYLVSLVGMATCVPYALWLMRGASLLHVFVVLPWALLLFSGLKLAAPLKIRVMQRTCYAGLFVLILYWHWMAAGIVVAASGIGIDWQVSEPCRVSHVAPAINALKDPPAGGIILTDIMAGPEVVYRTRHRVVGAPYHLNVEGIKDTYRIFGSAGPNEPARKIASHRGIDLILVCRKSGTVTPEDHSPLANPVILHQRLLRRQPPKWLATIPLPVKLEEEYLLYRVLP